MSTNPRAFGRPAAWGSALALAAAFLMGSSSAFAAAPAANAAISNQASASYLDTNGNPQLAASNVVVTAVQQVGSFTLGAQATTSGPLYGANTKAGAAGAVIYAPHVLSNTGNGSDSFNISVAGSANHNIATWSPRPPGSHRKWPTCSRPVPMRPA